MGCHLWQCRGGGFTLVTPNPVLKLFTRFMAESHSHTVNMATTCATRALKHGSWSSYHTRPAQSRSACTADANRHDSTSTFACQALSAVSPAQPLTLLSVMRHGHTFAHRLTHHKRHLHSSYGFGSSRLMHLQASFACHAQKLEHQRRLQSQHSEHEPTSWC